MYLGAMTLLGRQRNRLCRMRVCPKNGGYPATWSFFKGSMTINHGIFGVFTFFRPSHIWQGCSPNANNQWPLRRLGCFMRTKSVKNLFTNDSSWMYIYININSQSIVWFYKVIYDIILTNSPSQPWPWQADLVERVNQVVEVCDGENWVVLLLKTLSSIRFWRIY